MRGTLPEFILNQFLIRSSGAVVSQESKWTPLTFCSMQDTLYYFSLIEATATLFGFDLYVGNLHQEFYQRKSLVCDLIEPFRSIVDYSIRKLFNLGEIKLDDFEIYNGVYRLKRNASKNYQAILLKEIIEYREDIYKYVRKYYLWIRDVNQRKYEKFLLK